MGYKEYSFTQFMKSVQEHYGHPDRPRGFYDKISHLLSEDVHDEVMDAVTPHEIALMDYGFRLGFRAAVLLLMGGLEG